MQLDHYRLLNEGDDQLETFKKLFADVEYQQGALLYSEALFMYLCVLQFEPLRIVETGRGHGVSTEMLAKMFPDLPVLSYGTGKNAEAEQAAKRRCGVYSNLELKTGDQTKMAESESKPGDFLLVDGPLGMEGLSFMLSMLATRNVEMAFLHDVRPGSPERQFLEKHFPETCYSDDPDYAKIAHCLDDKAKGSLPADQQFEQNQTRFGYGYSLACLPYDARLNYAKMARKASGGFLGKLFGK